MKTFLIITSLPLFLGACKMTEPPKVSANATAMTQYVWRGLPMTARPVAQGAITTDFEVRDEDRLKLTTWGTMSLTASNGDSLFQNSDFLDLDETRLIADYYHPMDHQLTEGLHAGVINYTYAGLGGSTREIFVGTEWDWREFVPALMLYWDIDERDGMYLNGSIRGAFEIDEKTPGYWKVGLGFGSSRMNRNIYGDDDAGFSDLTAEVGGTREINKNTKINAFGAFSNLFVDDDQLDAASINSFNIWAGIGMSWAF